MTAATFTRSLRFLICAMVLFTGAIPSFALAVTSPASGAVAKPSNFTIVPPWAAGASHRITKGYNSSPTHLYTNRTGGSNDYYALDFDFAYREAVYPVAGGRVHYAGQATGGWSGYGRIVLIDHQNGFWSLYAHLDSVNVSTGRQNLTISEVIGFAGSSGTSVVHLHLAMYKDVRFQNSSSGIGPYGGQAMVPEPFASCSKNGSSCENLRYGDTLTKSGSGDTDDNRTLTSGQTLNGTISPNSDTDTYFFQGTSGQVATLRMNKTGTSTLDSYLSIYKPDGSLMNNPAFDDDRGGNNNALADPVLTVTGQYRVVAQSYNGGSGGAYSLSLTLGSANVSCSSQQYTAAYFNNTTLSDPV